MFYRVGFLGVPNSLTPFEMTVPVPWTRDTVGRLKYLGFNTVQLNVAWGARPGDEPLNLEDVVALSPEEDRRYPQMELFPWDTSWWIREVGRSRTDHSLDAAMLRGQQAHTPSWFSTRASVFMKTDDARPDPWMLEDVQLRCQAAADCWAIALEHGQKARSLLTRPLLDALRLNLRDLARLRRRALAYAYHLRETNLATALRKAAELKLPRPERSLQELRSVLRADLANHGAEIEAASPEQDRADWPEMAQAIALLDREPQAFLQQYLTETPITASRGWFSVTSRWCRSPRLLQHTAPPLVAA